MKAEDVDAGLVEKAARATYYADPFYRSVFGKMLEPREVLPWDELDLADIQEMRNNARHALAAVVPEIQAQALRDAAEDAKGIGIWSGMQIDVGKRAAIWLRKRAARLTATPEEPTT